MIELKVERWQSHPSDKIYIVGHFSLFTRLSEHHFWSVIFNSAFFCLGGDGGSVRCFCLGICEGPCINPIWEVGGP